MRQEVLLVLVVLFFFSSCSKSEDERKTIILNKSEVKLLHGQTFQIEASGVEGKLVFAAENGMIAKVDENGLVTGVVIGETDILIKDSGSTATAKCHVVVKPRIKFIPEPYLGFGDSFEKVKEIVTNEDPDRIIVGGIKITENRIAISRDIDGIKYVYGYSFEDNKLKSSMILYDAKSYYSKLSSLLDFISERYFPIERVGTNNMILTTVDKKIMIVTDLSNGFFTVYYTKVK
ncbi:hypothetical protein [Bacteroides pyogenes]|uniref:hypothetical protein n=1 Tax=Bacteroides pyogenes TaxID=310300 RepID=UPI001BA851EB|nr:hypothetical protein [Bacteroides pyogenes]MBR8726016.1 hypothetical protein [Bacteroides pyogenes]MBR8739296.1 hypothetical protein [Bacteroides pyogenes]MBR8755154.1 hypothetical protein [Bacteroides pyogenes]MBR8796500.1 hypothetical protein [Bacteroides pyogenes]MBR8810010.1 hypothetical protein [Bacteroides pyogenes]